jgi:hypothetical protein
LPRHITPEATTIKEFATRHEQRDPRQEAESSVMPRPTAATKNATNLLSEYPDLAVVVANWRHLPDEVRTAILAIVKTASG